MATFTRRTLFWKYAAYFAGLVSALLIVSGALGGYFAYREAVAALDDLQRAKAYFAATEITNFMRRLQDAVHATVAKFYTTAPVDVDDLRIELVALLRHHLPISELHWVGRRRRREIRRIAADGREQPPQLVRRSAIQRGSRGVALRRACLFPKGKRALSIRGRRPGFRRRCARC